MQNKQLQIKTIESQILSITGGKGRWIHDSVKVKRVSELIEARAEVLNAMFRGTEEEVRRIGEINQRLLDMTIRLYQKSANQYRSVLTSTDNDEYECIHINGKLLYDGEEVVVLEDDSYYGSDFAQMHQIIGELYQCSSGLTNSEIIEIHKEYDPTDTMELSDKQLGFAYEMEDGQSWAEGPLKHEALKDILLCYATHRICAHQPYSLPDLVRMTDFWMEINVNRLAV